jgi:hypothetical protein
MITLCVTVFRRHDLLLGMLESAWAGTVVPQALVIIDQVGRPELLRPALRHVPYWVERDTVYLGDDAGSEASAINFYLRRVEEERVIAHEDVIFGSRSLEQFLSVSDPFVIDASMGVMTYRDVCVERAGYYDTTISPGSFLYCDVDYEDRLAHVDIHPVVIPCGVQHLVNGTRKSYGPSEDAEFWRRAEVARKNYERKWGRPVTPGGNTIGRAAERHRRF